ncbi:hypothetical protein Dimus_005654 [Dionaea muscipula]
MFNSAMIDSFDNKNDTVYRLLKNLLESFYLTCFLLMLIVPSLSWQATEPRLHDTIVKEYQAARLEAISAKEKGDKKDQERASNIICKLKQEVSSGYHIVS